MKTLAKIKDLILIPLVLMIVSLVVIKTEAQVMINKSIPDVILKDESGGCINGDVWDSSKLKRINNLILYVAPNQQTDIEALLLKVDGLKYSKKLFTTTLILNTKATWIPNSIIESKVKNKSEEDSTKTYVLDKDEVVLSKWQLSNDNPNIILVDESGQVTYLYKDELNEKIENELLYRIELQINKGEKK